MKIIITLILFLFPIQKVLAAAAESILEDDISDSGMTDCSGVLVPISAGVRNVLIEELDIEEYRLDMLNNETRAMPKEEISEMIKMFRPTLSPLVIDGNCIWLLQSLNILTKVKKENRQELFDSAHKYINTLREDGYKLQNFDLPEDSLRYLGRDLITKTITLLGMVPAKDWESACKYSYVFNKRVVDNGGTTHITSIDIFGMLSEEEREGLIKVVDNIISESYSPIYYPLIQLTFNLINGIPKFSSILDESARFFDDDHSIDSVSSCEKHTLSEADDIINSMLKAIKGRDKSSDEEIIDTLYEKLTELDSEILGKGDDSKIREKHMLADFKTKNPEKYKEMMKIKLDILAGLLFATEGMSITDINEKSPSEWLISWTSGLYERYIQN